MESYCSLCILDTIHRLFFVTRLIINQINKVQCVDFKLENVLSISPILKNNEPRHLRGLGYIISKEWRVTWTFSYTYILDNQAFYPLVITPHPFNLAIFFWFNLSWLLSQVIWLLSQVIWLLSQVIWLLSQVIPIR
jgi:hypothetical protein